MSLNFDVIRLRYHQLARSSMTLEIEKITETILALEIRKCDRGAGGRENRKRRGVAASSIWDDINDRGSYSKKKRQVKGWDTGRKGGERVDPFDLGYQLTNLFLHTLLASWHHVTRTVISLDFISSWRYRNHLVTSSTSLTYEKLWNPLWYWDLKTFVRGTEREK